MKHDKNLVLKKDIQVSFYKILLFALLLHIYKYLQLIKWPTNIVCIVTYDLEFILQHLTNMVLIIIIKFDMVFIMQHLIWY